MILTFSQKPSLPWLTASQAEAEMKCALLHALLQHARSEAPGFRRMETPSSKLGCPRSASLDEEPRMVANQAHQATPLPSLWEPQLVYDGIRQCPPSIASADRSFCALDMFMLTLLACRAAHLYRAAPSSPSVF